MYAIEFETVVNKPYIKLENYLDFFNKKVKIIVLSEQKKEYNPQKNSKLFFDKLRKRDLKIDNKIDIDAVMNEMSSGLS